MEDINGWQDAARDHSAEEAVVSHSAPIPAWLGRNGTAAISVSKELYTRKAVLATAYKFSDQCAVLLDTDGENRWVLFLIGQMAGDSSILLESLIKELGDQALREQLEAEFGQVRTLIVAQAFSEGDLLDPDKDADDQDGDPRGTGQRR